jgi:SAM-dependent methyltransferase
MFQARFQNCILPIRIRLTNRTFLVSESKFSLPQAFVVWWRQERAAASTLTVLHRLVMLGCEFVRDSLPESRRQRYGDIDYDWEHRVNTTGATVRWRTRILGLLNSPYQPVPPEEFREMMAALAVHLDPLSDFSHFTFIDIGSGKGRALLLATEYGFRRIIGIELLPELDRIARENALAFKQRGGKMEIEVVCGDATTFRFPVEPIVLFLFNPLPEPALRVFSQNLENSLRQNPRPLWMIYANPAFEKEKIVAGNPLLSKVGGTHQYSLFRSSREN